MGDNGKSGRGEMESREGFLPTRPNGILVKAGHSKTSPAAYSITCGR